MQCSIFEHIAIHNIGPCVRLFRDDEDGCVFDYNKS